MSASPTFRTYQFRLSKAKLDVRSEPADMSSQSLRWLLNCEMGKTGRLQRRRGWTRLLYDANYNNQDLHDQLLPIQSYYDSQEPPATDADKVIAWPSDLCAGEQKNRSNGREVITLIKDVVSTNGSRRLVAATRSRIYELNEATGNWRILGDGFSGNDSSTAKRWQSGQAKNFVCFTNDYDLPMYYEIGKDNLSGCAMSAIHPLPTLESIKLSKAAMLCVWKNVIFLGNVELDYGRLENKIVWSDLVRRDTAASPEEISFLSTKQGTVAGDADLSYGHKILRMLPLGNNALVYTTRGIWRVTATGGAPPDDSAFAFEPIYENDRGDKCLAYPEAIASTGDAHYFLSREGYLYRMDAFNLTPQRLDWLADASDLIPRTIDQRVCDAHCMAYDATNGEIHVSWAKTEESTLGPMSFVFTPEEEWGTYVDAEFTAYGSFTSDQRLTFRDFLRNIGICTTDQLSAQGGDLFLKEGLPIDTPAPSNLTCIYTTQTKTEDGIETENWDAPYADELSLCHYLETIGMTRAEDFCQECNETLLFIGAHKEDGCLKQLNTGYAREWCANGNALGVLTDAGYISAEGIYVTQGYVTRMITGPMIVFDDPTQMKLASYMELESETETNSLAAPARIGLKIGTSYQALDTSPHNLSCQTIWGNAVMQDFKCPLKLSTAEYRNSNLSPAFTIEGPFHKKGRYLYVDISIGAEQGGVIVPGTGGGGAFSNFRLKVKAL